MRQLATSRIFSRYAKNRAWHQPNLLKSVHDINVQYNKNPRSPEAPRVVIPANPKIHNSIDE
jgi:hypothetical protein